MLPSPFWPNAQEALLLKLEEGIYEREGFMLRMAFDIEDGELVGVLGPSGAGKTTLLSVIAGFESLRKGKLTLDGTDIGALSPAARPVSMVFQDHNVFPHLTLWQNVALGVAPNLRLSSVQQAEVDQALKRVGLADLAQRKPSDVSGGERQRVALARVLVRKARVLLLDEPFAALDPGLRQDMMHLVQDLTHEHKLATLLVTHQPDEIRQAAARVIFVGDGATNGPMPTSDFFTSQRPSHPALSGPRHARSQFDQGLNQAQIGA